ncbi:hypothetical protein Tco_0352839 [Tanacetum coccineum]
MAALKFASSHNMVAFLDKPTESDGFEQIVDFLNVKTVNGEVQIQALVDKKKVIITETSIRSDLQLEDAEGTECLPNATIFEQLTLMGYENLTQKLTFYKAFFSPQWKFLIHTILQCLSAKTTAWNEFSSTIASVVICLATNQKFNFSKYIFDNMVKNLEGGVKFLMYQRFVQVFMDKQVKVMSKHKKIYVTPSYTKKVFANMKRQGKDFSGRDTPLFPTMLVQAQEQVGEGSEIPTDSHHTPTTTQPSTSKPQKKQSRRKQRKDTKDPQLSSPTEHVTDDTENVASVPTHSNDPLPSGLGNQEDASKQGRKIAEIDQDAEVTLVDETQGRYGDNLMFNTGVLDNEKIGQRKWLLWWKRIYYNNKKPKVVVQELVQSTTTTAPLTIPKAKSITFRDSGESTTRTTLTPIPSNIKDKGKAKMIKPEKPLKMKEQIRLDEELAFKLQAEEEEQARLAREKAEKVEEANISWDNVQAMIEADRLLAERLQAREQEELTDEEKARLFVELLEKRKKHFAALRAQEKRNKPPTKAQKKSTMSTYLKHMAGYKQIQLKNKSFAEIQKLFDKAMTRVNMFVDIDSEMKESSKKAEAEMAQESNSKRAGTELEQESIDREDLETLWKLVKAKHGLTRPEEGYKRVLWGDLKVIFEPDVESEVWRNLQGHKVTV